MQVIRTKHDYLTTWRDMLASPAVLEGLKSAGYDAEYLAELRDKFWMVMGGDMTTPMPPEDQDAWRAYEAHSDAEWLRSIGIAP